MPTSISLDRAQIRLEADRLLVRGPLAPGDENRYSNALLSYLSKGLPEYKVDLSDFDRVGNSIVGATIVFAQMARQGGRSVMVLASRMVAREFRLAGFDKVGRVRVVRL